MEFNKEMNDMKDYWKEKKRKTVQVLCAILYNCNFIGFVKGDIYQGNAKSVCIPGLNCYSCPGSVASCPLGSLQTALVSAKYKFPYYILGMVLLFGILLGRVICGFLCPFGWLQEILFKMPTPKIAKNKITRTLSYLKYVILTVFVIGIPLISATPGFCKYICPAGTLEGGIPLVFLDERLKSITGGLFTWKMFLLLFIMVGSVFLFRSFCRFLCPLGAFYSLFYKVAFLGVCVEKDKCNHCNRCIANCKMDIKQVGDRECIQCGECIKVCEHCAIQHRNGKM